MPTEKDQAKRLKTKLYASTKTNSQLYIGPSVLRQIYRQYSQWRQIVKYRNDGLHMSKKEEKVHEFDRFLVHYLLERCFWVSYGDSDVVTDLLRILYDVDGHLGMIFDYESLSAKQLISVTSSKEKKNKKYSLNSTWKTELLEQEKTKPIDYFMQHAYKEKVLFGRQRFAEQSILRGKINSRIGTTNLLFQPPCSLFIKHPEMLSTLLQYGLFAKAHPRNGDVGRLLTGVLGIWTTGGFDSLSPSDSTTTRKLLEMADMLLRAVKSVDISTLLDCQRVRRRSVTIPNILGRVSSEYDVLPKLKIRCSGPQELQHLCRYQIRSRLYDNWQLPNGIGFLPIPTYYQQYLHLMMD